MNIAIIIITSLIAAFLFMIIVFRFIDLKTNGKFLQPNSQPIFETPEFKAGMDHAFGLVQLCLYKMWDENDILDFENINMDIKNNLSEITKTKETFMKWQGKYTEFINNKKKEDNQNDDN